MTNPASAASVDLAAAKKILTDNDRDGHTVPTDGLYPFAWSWDSAITGLGWHEFDEARAWLEAETYFSGQWDNGMLPHILFHGDAASYFPGPDVWGSQTRVPSSAISQPPVWATTLKQMLDTAKDRALAEAKLANLLPKLVAYHRWWYRERDPENTGLVCSYHPWESGMDNSPAWDDPLAVVPKVDWDYQRRDLGHVDSEQRPHKPEYDRYLYLVDFYKNNAFDSRVIYEQCPYKVVDIGIVSILQRAGLDLLTLCDRLDYENNVDDLREAHERTQQAIGKLWSAERHCFLSHDLLRDQPLDVVTSATVLPLFGGLADKSQSQSMLTLLDQWIDKTHVCLSSTHPDSPRYEPQRYWRGPVWLHINWMVAIGASDYGRADIAERLRDGARRSVAGAGYWEYFDADSGAGCGGDRFSWTAAVTLYWLAND